MRKGWRRPGQRWGEATEGPIREEPQTQCQPSHRGLGCYHRPSGLPQTNHGSWEKPTSSPASYPPNLSTMALRFCARAPRGRAGADTLRSGAFSFFSCGGGGSVGLWGTSLGEDSLHGKVQRHVRGAGPASTGYREGKGAGWSGGSPCSLEGHAQLWHPLLHTFPLCPALGGG